MVNFRECNEQTGLFDLTYRRNLFTWCNKHEERPQAKKLDRVLINRNCQFAFPFAFSHFGEPYFSDHSLSSIVLGKKVESKKPFMISHFLLKHKEFLPRVAAHWKNNNFLGTSMSSLVKKLKSLKLVLKELNRNYFSDLESRVKEAHERLLQCQNRLMSFPSSLLVRWEKEAQKSWMTLAVTEEKFLKNQG